MSHRVEQVTSTLTKAIQQVLAKGLADPRIRGMITVTEVRTSKDLRHATVLVSIFPEQYERATIAGLQHATLRIQRAVNELMHMRRPPHLEFRLDQSLKKQAEILAAIREATAETDANAPAEEADGVTPQGETDGEATANASGPESTREGDTAAGVMAAETGAIEEMPPVSGTVDQLRALFVEAETAGETAPGQADTDPEETATTTDAAAGPAKARRDPDARPASGRNDK